jgi:hypothetical protein
LIDETRRAARELERLSRERRDQQLQDVSRQLNQTADEMQKAQASARTNSSDAIAQNEKALERLRQAQNRLQQSGSSSGQSSQGGGSQSVSELRQRAAQAAARQRAIANDVENMARRGAQNSQNANGQKLKDQIAERKDALADTVSGLQQDLEQSAQGMSAGQQRLARQLSEAAGNLSRDRIADRIRESKQALNNNQLDSARSNERAIERSLNDLSERLQSAEQNSRRAGASGAEDALDRTRQLADNLDSLRRRLDESNARRGQNGQQAGQQQSDSQSRQQGQSSQTGQQSQTQQSGSQGGQPQTGQSQGGQERTGGQWGPDGNWDDKRQLSSELRERLREAENLRRDWGPGGPVGRLGDVVEQLRRFADGRMEGDALTAAALKANVIEPLRQLELELSRQLQQRGQTNLRLRDEGAAPERYRKAVEEYYRRLSSGRSRQ